MKPVFVVFLFAALAASAADTYVDWTEYGGTYSGTYTDVNRWTPQTYGYPGSIVPGTEGWQADTIARFNDIDADYTVTFPTGTTTTYADLQVKVPSGRVVTFAGTDATWDAPACTGYDAYRYDPIYFYAGGVSLFHFDKQWSSTGARQNGIFSFKNFEFRVSDTNGVRKLDFLSGEFSFTPPRGYFFGTGTSSTSDEDLYVTVYGDSAITLSSTIYLYGAGACNTLTLVNQTKFNPYAIVFSGSTDSSHETTLVLDGTTMAFTGSSSVSAPKANLMLKNASSLDAQNGDMSQTAANTTFNVHVSDASTLRIRHWNLANATGARASLAVDGGSTFSPRGNLTLGGQTAETLVNSFAGVYLTNATASVAGSWTANNGEFVFGPESKLQVGGRLIGGTLGGTSRFLADGALVTSSWGFTGSASPGTISGFDTAELTENGLTFEYGSNYKAVTYVVPQDFSDAVGHEGKGKLAFTGKLTVELTAADSKESILEIGVDSGYRVTMKDNARHYSNVSVYNGAALCLQGETQTGATFKSLALGTSATVGVLELDPDEPVTVDGPINFVNGQLKFASTLPNGTHTVFKSTKAQQTGSAVTDWMLKKGFAVASGVAGYYSCKTVEKDGELLFQLVVSDAQPTIAGDATYDGTDSVWAPTNRAIFAGATPKEIALADEVETASMRFTSDGYVISGGKISVSEVSGAAIEQQTGTAEISSDMDFYAATELNVAEGATLTLGGNILGYGFTKTGYGTVNFEAPAMTLANGLTLAEGTTAFGEPATYDAKFNVATTNASQPVIVRADADVTLPIGSVTQGSLIKWGAGRLTLTADQNVTLPFSTYNAATIQNTDYDLSDYADTAAKPHGPLNIAEGELVIRGTSATRPTVTIGTSNGKNHIGLRTVNGASAEPAEPGLVIDHANVSFSSQEIHLGYALEEAKSFARAPYLVVTNGSYLSLRNFMPVSSMPETARVDILFDNSSFSCNETYVGDNSRGTCYLTFTNGSTMYNNVGVTLNGAVHFAFDRSCFCGSSSNTVRTIATNNDGARSFTLRNGSRFAGRFGNGTSSASMIFDDSEWFGGDANATLPADKAAVGTRLDGAGVVFAPASGFTWTFNQPLSGEGGLAKKGAGTLALAQNTVGSTIQSDKTTLRYSGLTDVQEGTLTVASGALSNMVGRTFRVGGTLDLGGASVTGAVITAAGGTIKNATLVKPTFTVEYDDEGAAKGITLDGANGCAVEGKVVFDFGRGATALPVGTQLTVANWTGTKPDVSRWRSANVGEGLRCAFVANDSGAVVATVVRNRGFALILR